MSSFLFLHFCDDALWLLGLYFSAFYPFRTFLRWLFTAAVQTSTGASRWSNRACEELPWCSFPYPASKTAHRATQGRVLFFPQNELTPPPKGGGAGYRLSWVGRVCPARSKLGHVGPTGPVRGFPGVVSLPRSLTGHKSPYRAELGFTAFSWCASFVEIPQAGTPGGNSLPREWGGSCKAASRFSQCRPMSTPLSAAFR